MSTVERKEEAWERLDLGGFVPRGEFETLVEIAEAGDEGALSLLIGLAAGELLKRPDSQAVGKWLQGLMERADDLSKTLYPKPHRRQKSSIGIRSELPVAVAVAELINTGMSKYNACLEVAEIRSLPESTVRNFFDRFYRIL